METYCQNPLCDAEAVKVVRVSVKKPSDERRSLCACCEEVFVWGVQHGKKTSRRQKQWILAIADKGIIAYAEAYRSKKMAEQGLVDYLRQEENYDGPDEISEAANWLTEHDERLSADIFAAEPCQENSDNGVSTDAPYEAKRLSTIEPPPQESGPEPLWRVLYTIDVNAADARKAALAAHQMMKDSQSWPPVLEVMDSQGHVQRVDLAEVDNDRGREAGHV